MLNLIKKIYKKQVLIIMYFYTFLNIVRGSLKECRYYLFYKDHKYCDVSDSNSFKKLVNY